MQMKTIGVAVLYKYTPLHILKHSNMLLQETLRFVRDSGRLCGAHTCPVVLLLLLTPTTTAATGLCVFSISSVFALFREPISQYLIPFMEGRSCHSGKKKTQIHMEFRVTLPSHFFQCISKLLVQLQGHIFPQIRSNISKDCQAVNNCGFFRGENTELE